MNAVKTQIWVGVTVYVLEAIVKRRLDLDVSLYTLLQVLSVTLFEKIPLNIGLLESKHISDEYMNSNQLRLSEI